MEEGMFAYRYSINDGETGGIVIAASPLFAKRKVMRYHEIEGWDFDWSKDEIKIWRWEDDEYYCRIMPDVMNCYGY